MKDDPVFNLRRGLAEARMADNALWNGAGYEALRNDVKGAIDQIEAERNQKPWMLWLAVVASVLVGFEAAVIWSGPPCAQQQQRAWQGNF